LLSCITPLILGVNRRVLFIVFIFTVFASCTKERLIFDSPANEKLELPLLFNINNKACVLDMSIREFKYSIPSPQVNQFSPKVDFQDESKVYFEGIELHNHMTNDWGSIEINKAYNLVFESNGATTSFQLFFTTLPIVQIVSLSPIEDEPKSLARLILNYPNNQKESVNSLVGVEVRGAYSVNFPKSSYGFKGLNSLNIEDEKLLSFFDMDESSAWILDAMYADKSKLRNKTSFEIWNSLVNAGSSLNYHGIRSEFVEVFYNYESLGIYCLNEKYTKENMQLNPQSLLISGKLNDGDTYFYNLPLSNHQNTYWGNWEQKIPEPEEGLHWGRFEGLVNLMVNGSDPAVNINIESYLNIDLMVDYYLFISLCSGYDNVGKNWLFLQEQTGKPFEVLPWDMDATWSRYHHGDILGPDVIITNGLFHRLIQLNAAQFKDKVKARWLDLRQVQFSSSELKQKFAANFEILLKADVERTETRLWGENQSLAEEQLIINNWIDNRLIFLDNYLSNL
jgi:spore coat protein H